jgi:hypothetical protein
MTIESKVMGWLKRWTPVVKEARAFVLALVALVAAIAALVTAIRYVGQVATTREQTKAALTVLATGQDQLAVQSEQNYKDIAALREYVAKTPEVSKVSDVDGDGVPDDIQRVHEPLLVGAGGGGGLAHIGGSRTRPPPVASASPPAASGSAAMAPPEPPKVSPPPAPPRSLDVDSVFY